MRNVLLQPTNEPAVTYPFTGRDAHNGLDLGWLAKTGNKYQPIYACQEGVVVAKFSNSSVGNAIVLEHCYGQGLKRWTGYIHMHKPSPLNVGARVQQGQQLGIMGNTGKSYGNHLHLYVTQITSARYTWENMRANVVDPLPLLYCDKKRSYIFAEDYKPKWIQDVLIYPEPVARDESKHQVRINSDTRIIRVGPSINAIRYDDLCKRGIYNVLEQVSADGYKWSKIKENYWVATMKGDNEYQPVSDYRRLYQQAKEQVDTLAKDLKAVQKQRDDISKEKNELATLMTKTNDKLEKAKKISQELFNIWQN